MHVHMCVCHVFAHRIPYTLRDTLSGTLWHTQHKIIRATARSSSSSRNAVRSIAGMHANQPSESMKSHCVLYVCVYVYAYMDM